MISETIKRVYFYCYHGIIRGLLFLQPVPRFLAHGGLHFIVLVLLAILVLIKCSSLRKSNVTSFTQYVYTFYGDTLHNYKMNYIYLEKDFSRKDNLNRLENDIILTYAFEPITIDTLRQTKYLYNKKDSQKISIDLVSKIHFVKVDNRDIVTNKQPNTPYKPLGLKNQYVRKVQYTDHDRYYYSCSKTNNKDLVFNQITHYVDSLKDEAPTNPYSVYWLGVNIMDDSCQLNSRSQIKIKYNNPKDLHSENGIGLPLTIESISPEPTEKSLTEVVYREKELKQVIRQGGIYISTLDPIKKANQEQESLLYTVFLGALFGFLLDIIVQQIIKWRKLKNNNNRNNSGAD